MSIRSRRGNTFKNALEKWKFTKDRQRAWAINSKARSKSKKSK